MPGANGSRPRKRSPAASGPFRSQPLTSNLLDMHSTLLVAHSLLRWLVLAVALYAVLRMATGLATGRAWLEADRKAGVFFAAANDADNFSVGANVGIALFAVSPVVRQAMSDVSLAMRDAPVRFFLAEHPAIMVLAVTFAHAGSVIARRGPTDRARFVRGAVGYSVAFALLLAGIPWWRLRAA